MFDGGHSFLPSVLSALNGNVHVRKSQRQRTKPFDMSPPLFSYFSPLERSEYNSHSMMEGDAGSGSTRPGE